MMMSEKLHCESCGSEVDNLRRDMVDADYNALNEPVEPVPWDCNRCYEEKRTQRQHKRRGSVSESAPNLR